MSAVHFLWLRSRTGSLSTPGPLLAQAKAIAAKFKDQVNAIMARKRKQKEAKQSGESCKTSILSELLLDAGMLALVTSDGRTDSGQLYVYCTLIWFSARVCACARVVWQSTGGRWSARLGCVVCACMCRGSR